MSLKGKTLFITGASRGIGHAIGVRAAKDGANVVIVAKTTEPHPKLPGTIYTAAEDMEKAGGKALPLAVDIRDDAAVYAAVAKTVETFGGIDILVNNASAISLTGTLETPMKRYDLMHNINTRGTFLCSQACIPHLKKAANPHILNLSPPLSMKPHWFGGHVAYTMAKYGMSMCVLGMAEEFKGAGIAVNALWPRTAIATAAVQNLLGGDEAIRGSRTVEIMADAAHVLFLRNARDLKNTGNFYIDDDVLGAEGVTDFTKYAVDPNAELVPDFFVD
ncbi:MAG: SDR family oxidoreductase [Deltaproteobacteria bacterium]|jgi:citronellol/citronellal dehydrogenase